MKKCLTMLLLVMLILPSFVFAEDQLIIDKIANPHHPFTFPEDAQLLEIYFPRIDDCDAAYIRFGEYSMLLDCAGEQWERVRSLLHSLNVTNLTYAYASHPHTDHIGGFQHLLKEVKTENFLHSFPENYPYSNKPAFKVYDELHRQNVPFRLVRHGDTIDFGAVKMTVFQHWNEDFSGNNNSPLLLIAYGERSFLFTADIQRDAQLTYVNAQDPIQADIMKFPHHGYNRMQQTFLKLVDPQMVVVTGGKASANGVALLKELNCKYQYTERGVLRFTTDGNVWVVERLN